MGRVVDALQSERGLVRRVEVNVYKDNKTKTLYRQIGELILLLQAKEDPQDR